MNIEQAYIKSEKVEQVTRIVERRLNGDLQDVRLSEQIKIPDSYEVFLANNEKRKIAISNSRNCWITIVESKEVNDYAMLLKISEELMTDVLAIAQYDSIGAWGYVEMKSGKVIKSYYSEEDDNIEDSIEQKKGKMRISESMYLFKDVVCKRDGGWNVIQKIRV